MNRRKFITSLIAACAALSVIKLPAKERKPEFPPGEPWVHLRKIWRLDRNRQLCQIRLCEARNHDIVLVESDNDANLYDWYTVHGDPVSVRSPIPPNEPVWAVEAQFVMTTPI